MTPLPAVATPPGPLVAAMLLWALAFVWLLPRPRGRSVTAGTAALIAGLVVFGSWLARTYGEPARDEVEQALFWVFATAAVLFAAVFLAQRNPARGAIAFAFVILSTCGLFLTLAAPFLMAATVIIYAGAVIVTFLFVLMLSQTGGATDENDRSREPLLGSLAGFAFLGLVLFAHYLSGPAGGTEFPLPARPVTADDRAALLAAADRLRDADQVNAAGVVDVTRGLREEYARVLDGPAGVAGRMGRLADPRAAQTRKLAADLRAAAADALDTVDNRLAAKPNPTGADLTDAQRKLGGLREKTLLLAGQGELPARNVAAVGYALYTDHLLGIEMAGAVLLVATIGAVAIAGRKGAAS